MFERYLKFVEVGYLPMSNTRYLVDRRQMSVSDNGQVVSGCDKDGIKGVVIDWYDGYRFYQMKEIVAHVFKPTQVPVKYWTKISVEVVDGNENNIDPENLVWRFPAKLGLEDFNGFCFIPMYSRYMVNTAGVVYDLHRNRFVKGRFCKGYFVFSLTNDLGESTSLSRHRAIGLVFLKYPVSVDKTHINHINGLKGDDRLENLEWVNCSENRTHALDIGLVLSRKPVVVENEVTGETKLVKSIRQVCVAYGIPRSALKFHLKSTHGVFKKWPYRFYLYSEEDKLNDKVKTPVLVRNLRTGEIKEYASLIDCSRDLNITKHMISSRIEDQLDKIHPDGLQIRRKSDKRPWYTPPDIEFSILNSGLNKPCLLRKCLTGEIVEYATQRLLSQELSISEASVHEYLSDPRQPLLKVVKWNELVQIKKKYDGKEWRIPDDYLAEYNNSKPTKTVIVRDIHTDEEFVFDSAVDCAKHFGILTTTLNWRLKTKGQRTFEKRYQFKYMADVESFKKS